MTTGTIPSRIRIGLLPPPTSILFHLFELLHIVVAEFPTFAGQSLGLVAIFVGLGVMRHGSSRFRQGGTHDAVRERCDDFVGEFVGEFPSLFWNDHGYANHDHRFVFICCVVVYTSPTDAIYRDAELAIPMSTE